jgi:cytochrome c oxidase subunit IV
MQTDEDHIIPYHKFLIVLLVLITLTLTSVALTQIYLGTLTVVLALVIAAVKSSFVLRIFMHLKFESRLLSGMITAVALLICVVITLTLLDYLFR